VRSTSTNTPRAWCHGEEPDGKPDPVRLVLGLDVDSTIWDLSTPIAEAVLEVTGEQLDSEAITTWTHVLDAYGEEATMEIYTRTLSPHRARERKLYPGATEVLRYLQNKGIGIHFITHNWDPEGMKPHLEPWLKNHFGPDIGLSVTTENKLDVLHTLNAFGMVDDRPETILRVADVGLWAATLVQPWNRELVANHPNIHGFESWYEVPSLLSSYIGS
jgi:phosphoglycolate phosphatase-like HAD superfamily hydrolase